MHGVSGSLFVHGWCGYRLVLRVHVRLRQGAHARKRRAQHCLTARGAADCYAERSIMFWDVAAGIAVSQGAGARLLTPNQFSLGPLSVILAPPSLVEPVTQLADRSRAFPSH
ncbi:MAG: inositol monophosphatase family protein [Actinomycetota bacterium]